MEVPDNVKEAANKVSERLEADVILYNGILEQKSGWRLISLCSGNELRKNVLLILVTTGGNQT